MRHFLAILFLLLAVNVRASLVSSNLYTLAVVNNTTNTGPVILLGTIQIPQTTFSIQNLGITATSALSMDILMGFGSTTNTMTVVGTYSPSATNQQIDTFVPTNSGIINVYAAVTMRTTNSLTVGAAAIQNH